MRHLAALPAAAFLLGAPVLFAPDAAAAPWATNGVPVCAAPGGQLEPVATPDGAGGVIIAWTDRRSVPGAIFAVRLTAGGAVASGWPSNGRSATQSSAGQYSPAIVSDGAGGAILAWADKRGGAATGVDVYAQHITANGATAPGWAADGLPVCRAPYYQGPPVMCSDGAGGAYIAMENGSTGSKGIVSVTRVSGAGTFAAGWSECGVAFGDGTSHESDPQIALDDGGGVLVVWSDWRLGGPGAPDIMAARVKPSGTLDAGWGGWICRAAGAQTDPVVVSDGAGGGVMAWQDGRSASGDDIYAQRMTTAGSIASGWPVDGAAVCTSPGPQFDLRMAQDGQGGAILAWSDGNSDLTDAAEIRAERISAAGAVAPSWPSNGLLCHDAPYGSILRGLVADGAGGVDLAVEDALLSGGTQYDVYVDHLTADGVLDRARFVACSEGHQQQQTVLVSDGSGGSILAWQDLRTAPAGTLNFAIYAQHVAAGDIALDIPGGGGPTATFALEGARPNPARGDLAVAFSLPDAAPARLELFDVSGRRLRDVSVGGQGAGRRIVHLGTGEPLRPGIYVVKLTRGGQSLTKSSIVLP